MMPRIPERVWRLAMSADRFARMTKLWEKGEKPPDILLCNEARLMARRAFLLWLRLKWRRFIRRQGEVYTKED